MITWEDLMKSIHNEVRFIFENKCYEYDDMILIHRNAEKEILAGHPENISEEDEYLIKHWANYYEEEISNLASGYELEYIANNYRKAKENVMKYITNLQEELDRAINALENSTHDDYKLIKYWSEYHV